MKAYIIGLDSDPDVGNEVVFAKNGKEARKIADYLDITDTRESYIDVTVHRYPKLDNKEHLSPKERMKEQWRLGWWFFQDGCPDESESSDEDFYSWYDKTFSN